MRGSFRVHLDRDKHASILIVATVSNQFQSSRPHTSRPRLALAAYRPVHVSHSPLYLPATTSRTTERRPFTPRTSTDYL
ncbi:hypothetical protein FIBSPDRAFT_849424 [Athelia psychrophila]|uniref:Uncharacterized protein n=1 Tax=Athelia psychrophila TaxID=1759441 RepID=A0A166U9D1_9AGAM|nr:hypothetical protein FIBSPDRAFT_849424 [Fibularhizoctonia sp. CBS 109695]